MATTLTINGTMTLGGLLALYRNMANIDQTTMGKSLGVSRPTVSYWERDMREPSFSQVVRWAQLTGQPLEPLVEAVNAKTAPSVDGAVDSLSQHSVRPKRLELPTFWFGVSRRWSRRDERAFRAYADELTR